MVLHGPRTVGKSTLLRWLADDLGGRFVDLDDVASREVARADPSIYVGPGEPDSPPVFIDEYQHVPELLDAIKATLNRRLCPGMFVITGSTNYSTLPRAAQSLTGRAEVLTVRPLTQAELSSAERSDGGQDTFVERLCRDPAALRDRTGSTSRDDYISRVLAGGMPVALRQPTDAARRAWFRGYLDLVVQRDVLDIRRIRQRDALPRLLQGLVAQTGQLLNMARAAEKAGLNRAVGSDYVTLLEAVFAIHRLPAWGTAPNARVNSAPKVHVFDTGLGGWLLRLAAEPLRRGDPTAWEQFGHLLESFVVNELCAQASWMHEPPLTGHFRTKDGHEVDLVLELFEGTVAAVEVKAGTRVRAQDLRGLVAMRDRVGTSFAGGVVLYTGTDAYRLDEKIYAVPIDQLWTNS